ncbi:hypothetical protein [Mycobacterium sp. 236(2023)]|uniref:hypothetical protein n=1 Tax=Mycobacterium sp. 236(2023) TaxID=3038163 RepID=UPI00241580F2|nr:hypothetical protein [Mycobacterium sp. 236(2023)]MDG4665829.1 hypothetical protein [Mycobacterium sp. 236(2023)]
MSGTPTTSAPVAGFPDLSLFTPVDTDTYVISYPYFNGFAFTTADGQECSHNGMNSLDNPSQLSLNCEGPRPDKGPGTWEIDVATNAAASIEQSPPPLTLNPTYTPDPSMTPKPLPAMHKVVFKDIECGTDGQGTLACVLGEHGFVLTPASTELF